MARKGREAELIVKELEKQGLGDLAEINSPGYILDVVTEKPREVDVSIRFSVGTHDFLTVIECRDRKAVQDVTWIEQVNTKTKDIKADKIIAVSTSGFTEGAKRKAEHNNIVLRTLKEFDANEIRSFKLSKFKILDIEDIFLEDIIGEVKTGKLNNIDLDNLNSLDKIIYIEEIGKFTNFKDIVYTINKNNDNFLFNDLEIGKPPVRKKVEVKFDKDVQYIVKFKDKIYKISKLKLLLDCWIEMTEGDPHKAFSYKQDQNSLLDKLEYRFILGDQEINCSIIKDHKTGLEKETYFIDLKK